jgi:hypothetical protein
MFEQEHTPAARTGDAGAEKPGGASADEDDIVVQPALRFRKRLIKASRESAESGRTWFETLTSKAATELTGFNVPVRLRFNCVGAACKPRVNLWSSRGRFRSAVTSSKRVIIGRRRIHG